MTLQRIESEELDQDTLDYLRLAARREGRGMPGVFLNATQANLWAGAMPLLAAVFGPAVMGLTLLVTWGSLRPPPAVALLMTSGLFLGGWMFVAAVRCLLARRRPHYLGHFKYVDPTHVWHATGTGVVCTPLDLLTGVSARHSYSEGAYRSSVVTIERADGDVRLKVHSRKMANRLEDFLAALAEVREGTPAERGYAALEQVRMDEDEEEEERPERVTVIPEPRRARASLGWLRYVLLAAACVGLFFCCRWLAGGLRDDALYAAVRGKDAARLWVYLNDRHTRRHREAVLGELARFYDGAAARVEAAGDPDLAAGLAEVVRGLKRDAPPVLTVGFKKAEKGPDAPEGYLSADHLATLRRDFVARLAPELCRRVGEDLVDVAFVPDGPAMVEVAAEVKAAEGKPGGCAIEWTFTFQADADGLKRRWRLATSRPDGDTARAVRVLHQELAGAVTQRLAQAR